MSVEKHDPGTLLLIIVAMKHAHLLRTLDYDQHQETCRVEGRAVSRHDLSHQLVVRRTNSYQVLIVVSLRCQLSDLMDFHTCGKGC